MSIVTDEMVEAAWRELCAAWEYPKGDSLVVTRALVRDALEAVAPMLVKGDAQAVPDGMFLVTKKDANNYCLILRALGMEDEGDPVAEVERLAASSAAQAVPSLPLDDDVREILGRPNFQCIRLAQCLRPMGHDIPHKAEAEQATVIHWMLGHYFRHGAGWRKAAVDELTRGKEAAAKGKDDE